MPDQPRPCHANTNDKDHENINDSAGIDDIDNGIHYDHGNGNRNRNRNGKEKTT